MPPDRALAMAPARSRHPDHRHTDRPAEIAGSGAVRRPRRTADGAVAARLQGLREVGTSRTVQLLVPHVQHRRGAGFVLVERTTRLPAGIKRDDLPCVPIVRAVLDTARRLRDPRAVQGLLAEAVQGGRCTTDQLLEELDAGSQRGTALVRAALVDVVSGARSVAEADALQLWRRTGLPEAQWNVALTTPTGQLIAVPDAWLPEVGLAWEIDSYGLSLQAA